MLRANDCGDMLKLHGSRKAAAASNFSRVFVTRFGG
jgi:hypothetical protein